MIGICRVCNEEKELNTNRLCDDCCHNPYWNEIWKKQTCQILKQHHEAMKDDPEHLTTEFLKKLINVDCKIEGDDKK